jgi:two-component system chemotaxis response regulator CheB
MKILVVDDSIVFRSQISGSLSEIEGLEVVGTAPNGRIAIQKLQQLSIDLITLDMEMPELGGLETIKEIKRLGITTKIIVFSSQTIRGAQKALEALAAGADDVVAKPEGDGLNFDIASQMIKEALIPRVEQFFKVSNSLKGSRQVDIKTSIAKDSNSAKMNLNNFFPKAVVIASSTGGPSALEKIFELLKCKPRIPIFIVQHMPPVFTQILAKRLGEIADIPVHEASDNIEVTNGHVYLAPGGFHMVVEKRDGKSFIRINDKPQRNSVRPAADYLFETAADIYREHLLGVVLTGMGEDGAAGARYLKQKGGGILIQDKDSCVVFGMPGAVFINDDYDDIMNLEEITGYLKSVIV